MSEHQDPVNVISTVPHSRSLQGKLSLLHLYIALAGIQVSASVMSINEVTLDVHSPQHDASRNFCQSFKWFPLESL